MKPITKFSQLDLTKQYSYADYLTWQFKERVELIRGWILKMAPAPNLSHQSSSTTIKKNLENLILSYGCLIRF